MTEIVIDEAALRDDLVALVRCPSLGGAEADALRLVAGIAERLGLDSSLSDEDLAAVRATPGYPGEEVERDSLQALVITLPGRVPEAPRLAVNGHIDVVPIGLAAWTVPPFDGLIRDGHLYGRGAADMKGGVVAALHAMGAVRSATGGAPGDVVLHVVAGEEDGGVGTFASLCRDADFAGCVIAEPTDGAIVCATAGALTWRLRVPGRAAHASHRLDGVSALDRFLPIYAALMRLEAELNDSVDHPLMREHELPYPLSAGRVFAGDWSSSVPDELVCEGRLGVPIGHDLDAARAHFEKVVHEAAARTGPAPEVTWTGGQFAPAETPTDHPLVSCVQDAVVAVTGVPAPLAGVPYGTDMRQYVARGIPSVLYGPGSVRQAHSVDEWVPMDEVVSCARVLAHLAASRFWSPGRLYADRETRDARMTLESGDAL